MASVLRRAVRDFLRVITSGWWVLVTVLGDLAGGLVTAAIVGHDTSSSASIRIAGVVMAAILVMAVVFTFAVQLVAVPFRRCVERRQESVEREARLHGEPSQSARGELARWLDDQIVGIVRCRRDVDEEAAASIPDADRIEDAASDYWRLRGEVSSRIKAAAPEWFDYFRHIPEGLNASIPAMTPTPEQLQTLSRFYGYTIDQITHIRSHLP